MAPKTAAHASKLLCEAASSCGVNTAMEGWAADELLAVPSVKVVISPLG